MNTANIVTSSFKWNSSLNISLNRNKITSLGDDNSDIRSGQGNTIIQRVGHPVNSYMLLEVERTLTANDLRLMALLLRKISPSIRGNVLVIQSGRTTIMMAK